MTPQEQVDYLKQSITEFLQEVKGKSGDGFSLEGLFISYGNLEQALNIHDCQDPAVGCSCSGSAAFPFPAPNKNGAASTKLPAWDEMSDRDKGAALLHMHKVEGEGSEYAVENYPARYFDHPALVALDGEDASEHAQRLLDTAEAAFERLGPDMYERLYDLALDTDRARA